MSKQSPLEKLQQGEEQALKPCPFCERSEAELDHRDGFVVGNATTYHSEVTFVVCTYCYTSGPAYENPNLAIMAWNYLPRHT